MSTLCTIITLLWSRGHEFLQSTQTHQVPRTFVRGQDWRRYPAREARRARHTTEPLRAHTHNILTCHSTSPIQCSVSGNSSESCGHGGVTRLCVGPKKFVRIVARRCTDASRTGRGEGERGRFVVANVAVVVPEMFYLWIMFTTEVRGHRHSTTAHHHQIHSQAQTHDNCNTTTARLPAKVHLTSGRPWRGFPTLKLLLFGRYTTRPACTEALQTLCCNRASTYLTKLLYKSRKLVKIKLLCLQRHVCDPIKHNNRQPIANHAGRSLREAARRRRPPRLHSLRRLTLPPHYHPISHS